MLEHDIIYMLDLLFIQIGCIAYSERDRENGNGEERNGQKYTTNLGQIVIRIRFFAIDMTFKQIGQLKLTYLSTSDY